MKRRAIRGVIVVGLVALGWAAGRAQAPASDFTLKIEGPTGRTNIVCVRGCVLQFSRYKEDPATATQSFWYECSGPQCEAEVNGWVKR